MENNETQKPPVTNLYPGIGLEEKKEQKKSGAGALFGSAIIIILVLLGGLYFWGGYLENRDGQSAAVQSALSEINSVDAELEALPEQDFSEDYEQLELELQ